MMRLMKKSRMLLLMGVIVAGLSVTALLVTGSAFAQAGVPGITSDTQVLVNLSQGLINRVSSVIPAEQKLGRDTSKLQAALADLEEIVNGTSTKGEQTIEGNGKRDTSIVTDYSERNAGQSLQRKMQLSYDQLKQIFDNFKATYPGDFAATTTSAGSAGTGASTSTNTVTTTTTTTPTVSATPTVTATTTTTSTAALPSTGAASSTTMNQAQLDNLSLVNSALNLIARAQLEVNSANARGLDTSRIQAASADLSEIANFTQTKGSDKIEGNGTRQDPIVTDFSERNHARWMDGDSRDYRIALRDSYDQLKKILDDFIAANP